MSDYWQAFLIEFCKVEAVCYNGVPNWIGWIAIAFALILLLVIVAIVID